MQKSTRWESRSGARRPDGPHEVPDVSAFLDAAQKRRLLCRSCGHMVTGESERLEVAGRHVHRRINPAGFEYEFGCFQPAAGASVAGAPQEEHSWFAGYTWAFSLCGRCSTHLGWFFDGSRPRFHGLILARLVAEDAAATG